MKNGRVEIVNSRIEEVLNRYKNQEEKIENIENVDNIEKESDTRKGFEDLTIIKNLVVGFLIVKSRTDKGISYINTVPLDISWDRFDGDNDIDQNEEIIGVIPAPQFSYRVLGFFPYENSVKNSVKIEAGNFEKGSYQTLGYEYRGVYRPDWKELLSEKIKNGDYNKRKR